METQRHLSTFQKGMQQDYDNLQMSKQSYLESRGGRVVFNQDGTYAWQPANGTATSFVINANYGGAGNHNYVPIGGVEINSKSVIFALNGNLIIFSYNPVTGNSEIGAVTQNSYLQWSYRTLFNDLYDPYNDKLNFSANHPMRDMQVDVENNVTARVLFNDWFNEPRTFNILLGKTFNYASPYPAYYSVHGMSDMPDLTWGLIKYQKTITGQLLSGQYQYAYRYIHQTGYASDWSPVSGFVLLTPDAISANWTTYQMLNSGQATTKGNQIELKYLDTRFQQVEVAAIYWETSAAPLNAYTFAKVNIPSSGDVVLQHQGQGAALTLDVFVQTFTEISKAKTGGIKDNTYHLANYSIYPQQQLAQSVLNGITAVPITRPMLSDATKSVTTTPLTNQPFTANDTVTVQNGIPGGESYMIVDDYINYKGTQWSYLFPGDFGGEIYPFAICVFDRKGQAFFVQHITDFTFPQRYSNVYGDNRITGQTTGTVGTPGDFSHTADDTTIKFTDNGTANAAALWYLNIMGIKFSGIDLSSILFDANGKLQVSGFMIVRTQRIKQLLAQGLIMAAGNQNPTAGPRILPQPSMFNGYLDFDNSAINRPYKLFDTAPFYQGFVGYDPTQGNTVFTSRANEGFFECPDFMFNNGILPPQHVGVANIISSDYLRLVNVCVKAYVPSGNLLDGNAPDKLAGAGNQFYQKNYRTVTTKADLVTPGLPQPNNYNLVNLGDSVPIRDWYPDIQEGTEVIDEFNNINGLKYEYTTQLSGYNNFNTGFTKSAREVQNATLFTYNSIKQTSFPGVPLSFPINTLSVLTDPVSQSVGNFAYGFGAYFIANYIRPVGGYNITPTLLQSRVYNNIGHFVPINNAILAQVKAAKGSYIFDDVEVWGGDCWLDYFTYYRLYANLQTSVPLIDYDMGMSFPVESQYNTALRQGNTYEELGPMPANTFVNAGTDFVDGLYFQPGPPVVEKLEDFNVNAVLQIPSNNNIDAYVPEPDNFTPIYDYPVNEIHSNTKIYGEKYDSYRLFPVDNVQSANGSYGQINSMQGIFNFLYILQDSGFARIRFNDREEQTASTGEAIQIGVSSGYTGHDYINQVNGTQHQFSVVNNGKAIHFLDADKGVHFRFAADGVLPVSDLYGMHSYFTYKLRNYIGQDNPLIGQGIAGVYDYKNKSTIYTFLGDSPESIEFNDVDSQYKDYPIATPNIYFNFRQNVHSVDPVNPYQGYIHDEGVPGQIYGVFHDSILEFVASPNPTVGCYYDNLYLSLNNQAASPKIGQITFSTEDMAAQIVTPPNDYRYKYLIGNGFLQGPIRDMTSINRLAGKLLYSTIQVVNDSSNTLVRISSAEVKWRTRPKV